MIRKRETRCVKTPKPLPARFTGRDSTAGGDAAWAPNATRRERPRPLYRARGVAGFVASVVGKIKTAGNRRALPRGGYRPSRPAGTIRRIHGNALLHGGTLRLAQPLYREAVPLIEDPPCKPAGFAPQE